MGSTTVETTFMPGARVLIAAEEGCVARLAACLTEAGHEPLTARDGDEALRRVRQDDPELAILGTALGRLNGFQICERLKSHPTTRTIPVVLLADATGPEARERGVAVGAEDLVSACFDPWDLLFRVRSLVEVRRLREQLTYTEKVLFDVARALESRESEEGGPCDTIAQFACRLGRAVGLDAEALSVLHRAALLHDIGKVGIRESVLLKRDRLTDPEMCDVRRHPVIGEDLCAPLPWAEEVLPVIRHYRERWDGEGYPDGLAGTQIPLLARVLSVADGFHAMTCDRPYRPAMTTADAAVALRDGAGRQWDPELVATFLRVMEL
jgi:putative two-component system response regulator